jgi:anaerobic magnesium-protoporphyrin IX monomethyl ester cyclase
MTKVQLVSTVADGPGLQEDRWYAPLGCVWVGNYLRSRGHEVEILDAQVLDEEEILSRLNAPLVGIAHFINSIHAADRIARAASEMGSTVVYGGQAATPLACQILERNADVDFVVRHDGEKAMEMLARFIDGEVMDLATIPNLAYREHGETRHTKREEVDLETLPFPDRRIPGVQMERLIRNFISHGSEEKFGCERPSNAYTRKGCPRRGPGFGCSFCARTDLTVRSKGAEQAYEEYRHLVTECGVDYICDDSDTWIHVDWLRSLRASIDKHGEIGAKLRVYGDVRDINEETAALLRHVGVDAVLVGMESGDEEVLRLNGKPMRQERMLKAAELLGRNGVKLCDAYVLGLIGESDGSIMRTLDFANRVRSLCETQITYWNLVLPLPGSPIWDRMMADPRLFSKYGHEYVFDTEELRRDFIGSFCNLGQYGYDQLVEIRDGVLASASVGPGEYVR